jgi:hypothetical protein
LHNHWGGIAPFVVENFRSSLEKETRPFPQRSSSQVGKSEGAQTKSLKHPERHFGSPIEIF